MDQADVVGFLKQNPKLFEFLKQLKMSGKEIGILTGGGLENSINKLNALGIKGGIDEMIFDYFFCFDKSYVNKYTKIYDGEKMEKKYGHGKVKYLLEAHKISHIPVSKILYVGDNKTTDIEAPAKAGFKTIYINRAGKSSPFSSANIRDINQLTE